MKVFLVGFSSGEHFQVAQGLIAKGVEVCYWIHNRSSMHENAKKLVDKNIVFHNIFDALCGDPAPGISFEELKYPDEDIFLALQPKERQIFQMMSQLDFSHISYIEKKRLYFKYVHYWYGVLRKFAPDAIFFVDIPHVSCNYLLYALAKLLNIKTIMFKRAKGLPDRVLFFDDFEDYHELRKEYHAQLQAGVKFENISSEFQDYYSRQNDPERNKKFKYSNELYTYIPDKIRAARILPQIKTLARRLKDFQFFRLTFSYAWMMFHTTRVLSIRRLNIPYWKLKKEKQKYLWRNRKLQKEYELLQTNVDWNKKFVYFPLHLQPECSTNPQGGIFDDQLVALEMLSRALPDGWVIYVKENPLQWPYPRGYFGRYKGYYKSMMKLKNIFLIPLETSTFQLIFSSQAAATITGTAGFEAIMRSKPALVFGSAWYQDCEGVFQVKGVDDCRDAFTRIINGYVPEKNRIFAFLKALEKVAVKGYSNQKFGQFSTVSSEENKNNFVEILYSTLI